LQQTLSVWRDLPACGAQVAKKTLDDDSRIERIQRVNYHFHSYIYYALSATNISQRGRMQTSLPVLPGMTSKLGGAHDQEI
jgi:hypothetical protein